MRVAVLGAGSWGTALALVLARNAHPVQLWGRDRASVDLMQRERCNRRYLPGEAFPRCLAAQPDLGQALHTAEEIVLAVPSHAFANVLEQAAALGAFTDGGPGLVWATKGLDPGTGSLLHLVARAKLPQETERAVLSGPSFAGEIARGLPAAVTVASASARYAQRISELLSNLRFRVYPNQDLVGVQIGGAVKNVLAIAAGIADGLRYGANARAALISRGLHEMSRLGLRLGARRETLMGLAGLGDLVLSCTDDQSRNRRLGLALGRGQDLESAVAAIGQVVEGVQTAATVYALARRLEVELPIVEQVCRVLDGEVEPGAAVDALFSREIPPEARI